MIRQDLNSSCRVLCTNTWRRLRPSLGGPTIWKLIDMCWQNIMKRDLECFPHSQAAGCNAFRLRSSNMFKLRVCATLQNVIVSVILCVFMHISSLTQERTSMAAQLTPVTAIRRTCTWQLEVTWKPLEKACDSCPFGTFPRSTSPSIQSQVRLSADSLLLVILRASSRPDHSAEYHTESYWGVFSRDLRASRRQGEV